MIPLNKIRLDLIEPSVRHLIEEGIGLLSEQQISVTSETIAAWCAERIERFSHPPLSRRSGAGAMLLQLEMIRDLLGVHGVVISVVSVEVGGVRGVVAEIVDAITCRVIDTSGRKRLGDVGGKGADERAIAEAMAICKVRGLTVVSAADAAFTPVDAASSGG